MDPNDPNAASRLWSTRNVRLFLFLAGLAALLFVIYASMLPLRLAERDFDTAVSRFQNIPWLDLPIERRADWIANGLIMLPSGFFLSGAVDWGRRKRWSLVVLSPFVFILLSVTVIAIEFFQIWFPPRVVSQNDLLAGVLGSLGGIGLWWLRGQRIVASVIALVFSQPGIDRWYLVMRFGISGLLLYSLLPLDCVLTISEFERKIAAGRVQILPFFDLTLNAKAIFVLFVTAIKIVPYTFITTLCQGAQVAIRSSVIWVIILELVKLPIFSRSTSATDILFGVAAVLVTVRLAKPIMHSLQFYDRATVWGFAAVTWSTVMLVTFLFRFRQIVYDVDLAWSRLTGIFAVPFARAQRSSEFDALENLLLKILVFAGLAFILSGWIDRARLEGKFFATPALVAWCLSLGVGIEVAQAFLIPLVPDVTDLVVYAIGIPIGRQGYRFLRPGRVGL